MYDLKKDLNIAMATDSLGEDGALEALNQYRDFDRVIACLDVDVT